jgi:Mn-dependent DtxR family transcriptional regulator
MDTVTTEKATTLLAMIRTFNDLEGCSPSYLDFIFELQASAHTVVKLLRQLEARGVLKIRHSRGGRRNQYTINGGNHGQH